jgi:hypothetical protein
MHLDGSQKASTLPRSKKKNNEAKGRKTTTKYFDVE